MKKRTRIEVGERLRSDLWAAAQQACPVGYELSGPTLALSPVGLTASIEFTEIDPEPMTVEDCVARYTKGHTLCRAHLRDVEKNLRSGGLDIAADLVGGIAERLEWEANQ